MATKNVYFYKLSLIKTETEEELNINQLKPLIEDIIYKNLKNGSIPLYYPADEQIIMDVLETTEQYLFARLSKKRRNNSIQKRNYGTFVTSPVLDSKEISSSGIEIFTYCIIGYKHGILSIAKNQGAPDENAIKRLFNMYDRRYNLQIDSIPNNKLISELYSSDKAIVNRITVEIPTPNSQLLAESLHVKDKDLLDMVQRRTNTVSIEIKPEKRGLVIDDPSLIRKLIDAFQAGKNSFNKVVLDAKPTENTRQKRYDLFEEYFKYPIKIEETHTENGRKVEYPKEQIQKDYRSEMMHIYNSYKEYILGVSNRLSFN